MPKQRKYTENAIIYLPNDKSREIYLIKEGKVELSYKDIETGEEKNTILGENDFFGLITALGNYMRDDTATAITNAKVIVFLPDEFETLTSKNPQLIRKFLQHFSHKLREIGSKVNSILSQRTSVDPAMELFKIGEYYQSNKKFEQAIYAYTKYTEHYHDGEMATTAKKRIEECRRGKSLNLSNSSGSKTPEKKDLSKKLNEIESESDDKKEIAKLYYDAKSLLSEKKYKEALKLLEKIQKHDSYNKFEEYQEKVIPDIGMCYLELKEYSKAIRILTEFIKKFPSNEHMKTTLFSIGKGYEGLNKNEKAVGFYKKLISMPPEDDPVNIKAKKRLEKLS